ncbi:hypothetical protein TrCOL_g4615 [Triparma columacea]|uniref:Thiol-disulfide oxidoreductase DCC n=1 Tax=Triparma columacea TaxID=722753 RepID=A0A9W7FZP3_9STRA|nr:hypothetical protein TrCOL_g4615 [Triparma columacea]
MLGLGVRCTANSFILSSKHNTRPTRIGFSTLYSTSTSISTSTSTQPSSYDNVILYDGVCNFCNAWVDILLQVDTKKVFRFAALQSATGMKCLEGVGKERDDISSVMLIKESRDGSLKGYQKSDCIVEVVKELGIPGTGFVASVISSAMPRRVKDGLYNTVARNRYNFMGKRTTFERINAEDGRFLND